MLSSFKSLFTSSKSIFEILLLCSTTIGTKIRNMAVNIESINIRVNIEAKVLPILRRSLKKIKTGRLIKAITAATPIYKSNACIWKINHNNINIPAITAKARKIPKEMDLAFSFTQ